MSESIITVQEIPESRSGDATYEERQFIIEGTLDRAEARAALLDSDLVPEILEDDDGELVRLSSQAKVENKEDTADAWDATVIWRRKNAVLPPFIGDALGVISFDTTGGIEHRLHSYATAAYNADGPAVEAEDFFGLIGVGTDGSVAGVDIVSPIATWEETRTIDDDLVTPEFLRLLYFLTGTMNSPDYRGYEEGENLFLGAGGVRRGDGDWEITFRHAFSPNVTDLVVAGITVASKRGWDYVWVYSTQDGTSPAPQYVLVEQVYRLGDHNAIDI